MIPLLNIITAGAIGISFAHDQGSVNSERILVQEVRISGSSPDHILTRVGGVAPLPNGSIAVLESVESRILVFSSKGELRDSIGRPGAGPGEFRAPRILGAIGDSLWVYDVATARVSIFKASGQLMRTTTLESGGIGILLSNGLIGRYTTRRYGVTATPNEQLVISEVGERGSILRELFRANQDYRVLRYTRGAGAVVGVQPFDDDQLLAVPTDGSGFVYVDRRISLRAGGKPAFRVTRIDFRGDTIFDRYYNYSPIELQDATWKNSLDALIPASSQAEPGLRSRIESALFRPSHLPAVVQVVVGRDGTTWLRRRHEGRSSGIWQVLDERGDQLFNLAASPDLVVVGATRNRLWGWQSDSDGVPTVYQFRIASRN